MLFRSLTKQDDADGNIAAICAAPAVVLSPLGILDGLHATCYPGFEAGCSKTEMKGERIVVLDRIITAAGPGVTFDFGLAIVEKAMGKEAADSIRTAMLIKE